VLKKGSTASSIDTDMSDRALTQHPSASVEDYLKAIWELAGSDPATTNHVAGRLSVAAASVTNMFGRLQEMGLVEYERYHGAGKTAPAATGRASGPKSIVPGAASPQAASAKGPVPRWSRTGAPTGASTTSAAFRAIRSSTRTDRA